MGIITVRCWANGNKYILFSLGNGNIFVLIQIVILVKVISQKGLTLQPLSVLNLKKRKENKILEKSRYFATIFYFYF